THKHIKEVLAASAQANTRGPWKIDLIMASINPGSFDAPNINLKAELAELKKQDVGIIAMKTSGVGDQVWKEKKKALGGKIGNLHPVALKKLWILNFTDNLVDGVIAGMKDNKMMEESLSLPTIKLTAAEKRKLKTLVKLQMTGLCHLCGNCETVCPEYIAVTDMIRYHAYVHQYDEKELARRLYAMAGYDPARLCNHCGRCAEVCPADVPITRLLSELSADMA
ncbi:unnamed protein product, partial [marine sediment metagenome]